MTLSKAVRINGMTAGIAGEKKRGRGKAERKIYVLRRRKEINQRVGSGVKNWTACLRKKNDSSPAHYALTY